MLEDLSWPVVQAIYERQAKKQLEPCYPVRWLGIDEIALRKGHNSYACLFDLLAERTQEYLIEYFKEKGPAFCEAIEVFSCDMWDGFVNTAETLMPNAIVVVDRFHLMGQRHQALDKYRRALRHEYPELEELKHLRWVLLKHPEELTPKQAGCWLAEWIAQAQALNNRYLNQFLKTLQRWQHYILNFFLHRITNGLVEGINNTIKAIKRCAYGFLNFEHFRLRVLVECR